MAQARICSILGCGKVHTAKGFCQKHYDSFRLYGDPLCVKGKKGPGHAGRWLRAHVNYEGRDCLLWPFSRGKKYGVVKYRGKSRPASRVMCTLVHGEPPDDLSEAAHICNNPLCVNPKHIRWATPAENAADKITAGTIVRGERVNTCRLTAEQAWEIKYRRRAESALALAAEYGVARPTIYSIRGGHSWAWL